MNHTTYDEGHNYFADQSSNTNFHARSKKKKDFADKIGQISQTAHTASNSLNNTLRKNLEDKRSRSTMLLNPLQKSAGDKMWQDDPKRFTNKMRGDMSA